MRPWIILYLVLNLFSITIFALRMYKFQFKRSIFKYFKKVQVATPIINFLLFLQLIRVRFSTYCAICFCDHFEEYVLVQKLMNNKYDSYTCNGGALKWRLNLILIYEALVASMLLGVLFYQYYKKNLKMKTSWGSNIYIYVVIWYNIYWILIIESIL